MVYLNYCNVINELIKEIIMYLSKQKAILILLIAGLIMVIHGLHGILKRKKINNHAHFVLSVGQLIAGLLSLFFFILVCNE